MPFSQKHLITVGISLVLSVLATSCSESKVSQCNRLIGVANKTAEEVQTITSTGNSKDLATQQKLAATADQAKAAMTNLKLSDETLQGFQQRFVTMYDSISKSINQLVQAVGANNSRTAEQAFKDLQTSTGQEKPLVDEVNAYCGGATPRSPQ
jgi:basic membrane lipoprotein Med (substrate-binding protein (PBP1-ABC) superfamily)